MAFKTWLYKGMQDGKETRVQRYGKCLAFVQTHGQGFDIAVFDEKQLRKLLKRLKKCAAN